MSEVRDYALDLVCIGRTCVDGEQMGRCMVELWQDRSKQCAKKSATG